MRLGVLILALALASCARPTSPPPERIVLVTIDTWRSDAIGASGSGKVATPNLDALAASGLYAPRAWASATITAPSHASILTGIEPYRHQVRNNQGYRLPEGTPTIASELRRAGYETAAFVSAHPLRHGSGFDAGFDTFSDQVAPGNPLSVLPRSRPGAETIEAAWLWVHSAPARFFLWVHLFEPHDPYEPPASYRDRYRAQPYYGEVAYVDELIGRLRAAIPNALWVVCGDHGEALGDHGEMTHGLFVYDATARVPLIVSSPGRIVPRRLEHARLIDVLPTVLTAAGVPVPSGIDGRSLLGSSDQEARLAYVETMYAHLDFGAAPVRALSDGRIKVIDVPEREAYDLVADPEERHNLGATASASGLLSRLAAQPGVPDPPNVVATAASTEALRSLGYVGAGGGYRLGAAGMDPKRFAPIYRTLDEAHAAALAGRFPDAASRYASLLATFPRSAVLESEYGVLLVASGRIPEGEPHLLRAVSLDPANVHAWLGLANVAIARGDAPLAEKRLRTLLAIDPDDVEGNFNLGLLYQQTLGRPAEARPFWERFLTLQPDDPEASRIRGLIAK
jgi:arylsulfatase A-like enzyme